MVVLMLLGNLQELAARIHILGTSEHSSHKQACENRTSNGLVNLVIGKVTGLRRKA